MLRRIVLSLSIVVSTFLAPAAALAAPAPAPAPRPVADGPDCPTDLFISEYIEGSSNNKAIEIFNGTGAPITVTNAYSLALYTNGSASVSQSMLLSGTVAAGGVHVVTHPSAAVTMTNQADQTSSFVINFNGDDAVALFHNGVVLDVFGQIGFDPGTEWGTGLVSTVDNTLVRKSSIMVGDIIGTDEFTSTLAAEWEGYANNTFDYLGAHTLDACGLAPDLELSKTAPATTATGSTIEYTVALSNTGQLTATGTLVTDTLPVGVTFVTYTTDLPHTFSQPDAGTLVWDLGDVLTGTSGVTVTIQATLAPTLTSGSLLTNTVTASTTGDENDTGNNTAEAGTTVIAPLVNELGINPPSTDQPYEFFELRGYPGASLAGYYAVVFEGDSGGQGTADMVVSLNSYSFGANGLLIIKSANDVTRTVPASTTVVTDTQLNSGGIENGANTYAIILSPSVPITEGTDYDTNNDGTLEGLPATATVMDAVGWQDGSSGVVFFVSGLTQSSGTPDAATRYPTDLRAFTPAAWYNGDLAGTNDTLNYDGTARSSPFPPDGALTPGDHNLGTFPADLVIAKTGPASAEAGSTITYTLHLSNTGYVAAESTFITDTFPADLTFITYTTSLAHTFSQPGGDSLVWSLGSVPTTTADGTISVRMLVGAVSNGTLLTNTVTAATATTETTTANNTATRVTTVEEPQPEPDLFITKNAITLTVAGEPLTYTLVYGNQGDAAAEGVLITDTLPAGFSPADIISDTSGLVFTDTATTRTWDAGSLPMTTTYTFTLVVNVPATQTAGAFFTNTVTLHTTSAEDNLGNNTAQAGARAYPLVSIYDIQFVPNPAGSDASPYVGQTVWVEGIVYAERGEVESTNRVMVIQDAAGGPWSGLYIFRNAGLPEFPAAPEGAQVRILGGVAEFNGLTELSLGTPYTVQVLSLGNPVPEPEVLATGDYISATTAEQWESVFIQFEDATVLTTPDSFGEWTFDDGSGAAKADDLGALTDSDLTYSAQIGDFYRYIRGVGYWSFSEYKLAPRSDADILLFYNAPTLFKSAPALTPPGSLYTYTLTISNQVGGELTNLVITDVVPANTTFAYANHGGVLVGDTVSWTVSALDHLSGTSVSFAVTATTELTSIYNSAYAVTAGNWLTPGVGASVRTIVGTELRIHDLQGAGHRSPFVGQAVENIFGIVTAVDGGGYYLQDPNPDGDPATSEAIFVDTVGNPGVSVGQAISISGTVSEFYPDFNSTAELSVTQLDPPFVTTVLSSGNAIPLPIVLGSGGRVPPNMVIDDDVSGDVETSGTFDAAADGLDFWESLEGMLVQVNDAIVVAPTRDFGEFAVVPDNGAGFGLISPRGAIVIRENDFNPERIIIGDALMTIPNLNTGAFFTSPITGVIDYNFGNFKINPATLPTANPGSLVSETTTLTPTGNLLTVATVNVENLDPGDGTAKFTALAARIVNNLQSPDVIVLEEIQDNNGATNNGVVNADTTLDLLASYVITAGGPTYEYRYIEPVNNADGGEGGGNIRVVFFYNPARVTFVDRPGAGSTTANSVVLGANGPELAYSPGRLDPTNVAFEDSRKPLAGEFVFNGVTVFVIGNHWNSKGGDEPLMGRYQPPTLNSEVQRLLQAQVVNDFVDDLLALDPDANIVVLGDLNDFQWSPPLDTVTAGDVLHILINTLPENERYSYVFDANAQVLDHILVSPNLFEHALDGFDVVHVNAEFNDTVKASDHDPSVARLALTPGDLDGSTKSVSATSVNAGDLLTYTLTLSNSGGATVFYVLTDTLDANVTLVSAPGLSGTTTLTGTGAVGAWAETVYTVTVQTGAAFSGTVDNSAVVVGGGETYTLTAPTVTVSDTSASADLSGSTKSVNTTTAGAGDLLTYTLTISNSGAAAATFALTDTLDANVSLVSAPGLNGTSSLTATGSVAGYGQQLYTVTVQIGAAFSGTVNNSASLSGDGQTRTLNAPAVSVAGPNLGGSSKTVNTTSVTGGDLLTYTLTISNSGAAAVTYHLTDTLDANVTLVSAPGLSGSSTLTGTGTLAGFGQQTYVVTVQVSAAFTGTLNNSASLSGDGQTRTLNAPAVTVAQFFYKLYLPVAFKPATD